MRIGVLATVQHSMFSGGATNTGIAIAEIFKALGHDVELVNIVRGSAQWWDDCRSMETSGEYRVVAFPDASGYDILFEIDKFIVTPDDRRRMATRCVWVPRHPFLISEMEASLFPTPMVGRRDLSGVSEIWCMDEITQPQDIEALRALFHIPLRRVPYVWSATPATTLIEEIGASSWIQTALRHLQEKGTETPPKELPWIAHSVETNTRNESSAVLPTVILREIQRRGATLAATVVHNTEMLKDNKYFMENTVAHCSDVGKPPLLLGRQRVPGWVTEPFSFVVSHLRFTSLRPVLLDCLWAGIPTIHNSQRLRQIGCGVERLTYTENSVEEAAAAFETMNRDFLTGTGIFGPGAIDRIRGAIAATWSSRSYGVQQLWAAAAAALKAPMGDKIQIARIPQMNKTTFTVGFCDMWENFQPDYNFFTLLLSEAAVAAGLAFTVIGRPAEGTEDLVIFGPFGAAWTKLPPEQPKVHFTGENTMPVKGPGVVLNLGFHHVDMVTEEYLRFPLWILYIDWFAADKERLVNPLPIPLEAATRVKAAATAARDKFCAFVVSNPTNPLRNAAFEWLNKYKSVDSAGRLMNTVGPGLFAGLGGGGGELRKMEFLKDYKFAITYENSSSRGYTTEKYLHAKAAGCVPIYWGDPTFERDFDVRGCIDARKFRTPQQLIQAVKEVDQDDGKWMAKAAVPALDSYRVEWARRTMAECARRLFSAAGLPLAASSFPRFLGSKATEAIEIVETIEATVSPVEEKPEKAAVPPGPVVATYTNQKFFQNLHFWLVSLDAHRKVRPGLDVHVFLAKDVSEGVLVAAKEKFPYVQFERVPEDETPPEFPDFWNPEHYGFKLWIYNELAHRPALSGRTVLYVDVASFFCRWPANWVSAAEAAGLCLLEDSREENRRWCSPDFCAELQPTLDELDAPQKLGGLVCFVAGSPLASSIFREAYRLGQNPKILKGPKWAGITADGKPFGHRHDQSILSILATRLKVPTQPLDSVYCDESLRRTFKTGRAIYVHRGNFTTHRQFAKMIDECYIINLDRRADRMERFTQGHTDFPAQSFERWSAVEGRGLTLTPNIAKLLRPNDFFWKKAVAGCALSHLGLWWKLANEQPDINNYLILEDDVKFRPGWLNTWNQAVAEDAVPSDADILYLGGVLPPNREGFDAVGKTRINDFFCTVAPNQCFGQSKPTPYFHFCAYAYILTKAGARKVMGLLHGQKGYWTSADHILCNPVDVLKAYVMDPMVAGCYQDDDPKYANSKFNDFSRVDEFDSDLWNNDERFAPEEIHAALAGFKGGEDQIPVAEALADAAGRPVVPAAVPPTATGRVTPQVVLPSGPKEPIRILNRPVVAHQSQALDLNHLYEYEWIVNLLGKPSMIEIEPVHPAQPPRFDTPLVILQRPYTEEMTRMLEKWDSFGASFYILHISDERGDDCLDAYDLSGCLGVIRQYNRPGLDAAKVLTIPLGYHWTLPEGSKNPLDLTPHLPFRGQDWSFQGTNWQGRAELLLPLTKVPKIRARANFFANWNDPNQMTREGYIGCMLDSIFVPCPDGMNPETYRFYEALECGALPLVVETEANKGWLDWVTESLPLLTHKSWDAAAEWMREILEDKERLEAYRITLLKAWIAWRQRLEEQVQQWISTREVGGNAESS